MDAFSATRLVVGVGFLLVAAWSDLRTRTVRDPLWTAMGTTGLALSSVEIAVGTADLERLALVAASAILFYAIFFGKPLLEENGFHLRPMRLALLGLAAFLVAASVFMAWSAGGSKLADVARLVSMPVMVLVYQGFYYARLLHGGADAKALIAITLLTPSYPPMLLPIRGPLPSAMQVFFPFSLVVFVDAAILFLLVPVAYLAYNAARGDLRLPQAFLGYRAPLDALPKHAWLMEQIDAHGEHILVLFPRRGKDPTEEVERLRRAEIERPWVQPKMPFLAPLAAGFVLAFLVGNLLLFVFPALPPGP